LVLKLKPHGIDGSVYNLIKAWLTDRQQRVCLDGSYSSWRQLWSRVPQGSMYWVQSYFLFLLMIWTLDYRVIFLNLQTILRYFAQSWITQMDH